jgi:tol-pal system protein YbgF
MSLLARPPRLTFVIWLLLGVVAAAFPAMGQADVAALLDRVERLQRDIDVLQRRIATLSAPSAVAPAMSPAPAQPSRPSGAGLPDGFASQIDQRLAAIETEMRGQNGRLEEVQFKLRQIETRLDRLVQDVEFRFQQLERGSGAGVRPNEPGPIPLSMTQPQPPPSAATGVPPVAVPLPSPSASAPPANQRLMIVPSGTSALALQQGQQQGSAPPAATETQVAPQVAARPGPAAPAPGPAPARSPDSQFQQAFGLLQQAQRGQADFAPAEQALKAFVTQNPAHAKAGDAQYWYGETLYIRRDFQGAAIAFGEALKKYPKAEKAPDALLRLGMALAQLNRKQDACGALTELGRRHPDAPPPVRQAAQRERQRIGC